MVQRLLEFELVAKGMVGMFLVLGPRVLSRLTGLPATDGLWPRLCGGLLIGIAAACLMQGQGAAAAGRAVGLSLGGLVAINIALAATATASLVLGAGPRTARGRLVLWTVVVALVATALTELAFV